MALSGDMVRLARGKLEKVERQRDSEVAKLDQTLGLIKTLEDKLKAAKSDVVEKTTSDVESLKVYIARVTEMCDGYHDNAGKTGNHGNTGESEGEETGEGASGIQDVTTAIATVTMEASPAAMTTSPVAMTTPSVTIHTPEMMGGLLGRDEVLESLIRESELHVHEDTLCVIDTAVTPSQTHVTPVESLHCVSHVRIPVIACDMIYMADKGQIAITNPERATPLQVYSLEGTLFKHMGANIADLRYGKICRDTHRNLYWSVCDGDLFQVTMDGQEVDRIRVGDIVKGQAYIGELDLYAVSDNRNKRISLIDARTMSVVKSFGSPGDGPGQFRKPFYLTHYVDRQGRVVVVVSDSDRGDVQLLDLYGNHLHTYGSKGREDGQLMSPHAVVADEAGRVIVCDWGNRRVVSYWTEGGEDRWRCLLTREQLGRSTGCVQIDTQRKQLIVMVSSVVQIYQYD